MYKDLPWSSLILLLPERITVRKKIVYQGRRKKERGKGMEGGGKGARKRVWDIEEDIYNSCTFANPGKDLWLGYYIPILRMKGLKLRDKQVAKSSHSSQTARFERRHPYFKSKSLPSTASFFLELKTQPVLTSLQLAPTHWDHLSEIFTPPETGILIWVSLPLLLGNSKFCF